MMPFRPDWLDGRTTQAHRWFVWAPHCMRHGKLDGVLADLTDVLGRGGVACGSTGHLNDRMFLYGLESRAH
jgi:hypothetical protein